MNSLLHNPFTELALPYFLVAFAAFEVIALIAGGLWIWLCDGTRDDDLPDVDPESLDPYEIAYLQGGAPQVTRLVVFDLIEQGVLTLSNGKPRLFLFPGKPLLRRTDPAPDLENLNAIQRAAWNWTAVPRQPSELMHRRVGLLTQVAPLCAPLMKSLADRRLLETAGRRHARLLVSRLLFAAFVGLGLYKLITMVILGHGEVVSLLLLILAGLVSTRIICHPRRLSVLGYRYLECLQLERGDWDHSSLMAADQVQSIKDTSPAHATQLLDMALFGHPGHDRSLSQLSVGSP